MNIDSKKYASLLLCTPGNCKTLSGPPPPPPGVDQLLSTKSPDARLRLLPQEIDPFNRERDLL